jgi:5-methylcytosine-specific restriction endonuclease McrA
MNRRKALKQKSIDYLGGKCKICGYNKCHRALTFHHRNPQTKMFSITNAFTSTGGASSKWIILKAELDKCDLLCQNCHSELHDKEDIQSILRTKQRKISNEIKNRFNGWPPINEVIEMVTNSSFRAAGKKLGISDTAIRKFLKRNNINPKDVRSIKNNGFRY